MATLIGGLGTSHVPSIGAALDKGLRQRLREDLAQLQRELKIPMLMITHDDDDVRLLADEVVHLRAGRIVAAAEAHPTEAA